MLSGRREARQPG